MKNLIAKRKIELFDLARKNRNTLFLLLWMMVVPFISTTAIGIWAVTNESYFWDLELIHWFIFYAAAIFSMAFAITSTTFLAFLGGYFLAEVAVPFTLISYLLASFIGYSLARFMDKGKFFETISHLPKARKFLEGLKADQFGIIVLSRISPVLPFAIINVVLSMIGVKLRPFLIAGLIGILPRILFFLWLGTQASTLRDLIRQQDDWSFQLAFIILLIISIVGFSYYMIKNYSKSKREV